MNVSSHRLYSSVLLGALAAIMRSRVYGDSHLLQPSNLVIPAVALYAKPLAALYTESPEYDAQKPLAVIFAASALAAYALFDDIKSTASRFKFASAVTWLYYIFEAFDLQQNEFEELAKR